MKPTMKLPTLQVLLMCVRFYTVLNHDATVKELGMTTNPSNLAFAHRPLLETRKACSLTCFRGRPSVVSCGCICKSNWSGVSCDERICKPWQRRCDTKTQCVNKLRFCDGEQHCRDGSDENACGCGKVCANGGRLDKVTCTCSCKSEWAGDLCNTPSPSARCGIRPVDTSRIIGGQKADIEHYPWQVQLRYRSTLAKSSYFTCGGTLISPKHVVTAAHCVIGRSTSRWRIYLGRTRRQSGGEKLRNVVKVFIHEQYDSLRDNNDIALMVLNAAVSLTRRIQPACLHRAQLQKFNSDSACFVSGWGSFEAGGILPLDLHAAQVVLIPRKQCADIYLDLTDTMVCASESLQLLGTVDTCQGDSGGPLTCAAVDSYGFLQWHLVGITSFGYGCGKPGVPGVYTKVSKFIDWLDKKMNSQF